MGHIAIPRNVFSTLSKMNMWVQLKKHPKYWVMVSACLVTAPSCAISTIWQKMHSYDFVMEQANCRLMKDDAKYQKYLRSQ